jgi:hypothetical protein
MSSNYDATEFIDGDFEAHKSPASALGAAGSPALRAPTRDEVDAQMAEKQRRLVELKRAQEELERERAVLEETRRRQTEFQTGRQEMLQHLTRGLGLLQEAEFSARRDAEQMAKAITDLRDAAAKVEGLHEEGWTQENLTVELTRALTVLENARMEWNAARLKFPLLAGPAAAAVATPAAETPAPPLLATHRFGELCRLGFALTWPVAVAVILGLAVVAAILLRR